MKKQKIFFFILYSIYILFLIFLMELILRVFFPTPKIQNMFGPPPYYKLSSNQTMMYELRPNFKKINKAGFRDYVYEKEKPEKVTRIAVIGDSIAFGTGVSMEESYAKQLEKLLNQNSERKYEVMNMGIPGYGTAQINELLKYRCLEYHPDIVIYGYWFNDYHKFGCGEWHNNYFYGLHGQAYELFTSCALRYGLQKYRWPGYVKDAVCDCEILKRLVLIYNAHQLKKLKRQKYEFNHYLTVKFDKYIIDNWYSPFLEGIYSTRKSAKLDFLGGNLTYENFKDYFMALREMKNTCEVHSIRLILLVTPVLSDFDSYKYGQLHGFIHKLAEYMKIEITDALPVFSSKDADMLKTEENDLCHFNEIGHKITAEHLYNYLKDTI